ncbi:MAG: UbiX family flavin prenyltransferase, partial [Phycisphaerales bacterium]|nr:UbiX family flavin prenyltransferase [Phycisphaerales bacterium]
MAHAQPPHSQTNSAPTNIPPIHRQTFVIGITGASGAAYALRLLDQLLTLGNTTHLIVTDYGKRLLNDELNIQSISLKTLCPHLATDQHADQYAKRLIIHPNKDVGALPATGSFLHQGMVILPCSSTSMGAIATGSGSNLLTRAAAVTLKERRPLIICHRETPLSLIDINNMQTLTMAGAIIAPCNPGLYLNPKSINDLIDFITGKALDL